MRCRVRLRDRFGVWDAETEDLGPRGCRIVTQRPQTVGALVGLTLASEHMPEVLEVTGQIVWTRLERPARAGISFAGGASGPGAPAPAAWFEALAAAEREARSEAVAGTPTEIEIEIEQPGDAPAELAERLSQRARELLVGGERAAAEVIIRRALALAPGDVALEAALRDLGVSSP
jgi:hypothetical protein